METIKQKLNLIHLCPQLKAGRVGLSLPAFGLGVGGGAVMGSRSRGKMMKAICHPRECTDSSGSWAVQR